MSNRITALKAQKRNPNRINVYLDGEFAFGLARIVAAWLQVGQELTDEKIASLQKQDGLEVAYLKAVHFISYRPRSETEICKRLADSGYDETVVETVLERLKHNGLAGDREFAGVWVENRVAFRPRSRRALKYELRQKGVTEDIIDDALDGTVNDREMAYQAANRYARRLEQLEKLEFRRKLMAYLGRKGFSYDTITPVVDQLWEERHSR